MKQHDSRSYFGGQESKYQVLSKPSLWRFEGVEI